MNKYYQKLENLNCDYEESYWGKIVDPDGIVRNRIDEETKFLANVQTEIEFINRLPSSTLLEIGCGLGFMLKAIDNKHEKFGVEVSKFASKNAEKYAKIFNLSLEEADLNENQFNIVVAHHVIEHVDNPELFLKKIKNILSKNGHLIISTPDFNSICAKLFENNYRMLSDKTHVSLFTYKSLKTMLVDFGFEIVDVDFPYFNTEFCNEKNILNMLNYNSGEISPACWGNFMTFYCKNIK